MKRSLKKTCFFEKVKKSVIVLKKYSHFSLTNLFLSKNRKMLRKQEFPQRKNLTRKKSQTSTIPPPMKKLKVTNSSSSSLSSGFQYDAPTSQIDHSLTERVERDDSDSEEDMDEDDDTDEDKILNHSSSSESSSSESEQEEEEEPASSEILHQYDQESSEEEEEEEEIAYQTQERHNTFGMGLWQQPAIQMVFAGEGREVEGFLDWDLGLDKDDVSW